MNRFGNSVKGGACLVSLLALTALCACSSRTIPLANDTGKPSNPLPASGPSAAHTAPPPAGETGKQTATVTTQVLLVGAAVPQITDAVYGDYAAPNDPYYVSGNSRWIDAYDLAGYDEISLQPYVAGPQQIIAVVDDGVYRNQYDPMRLTWMGIDCYDTDIVYGSGEPGQPAGVWGNPRYKTTNPRFEWPNGPSPNYYWHRYQGHGTQVCSIINSITNNGKGVPSFAPGAYVMPIGLKQWTKMYGLPGVDDQPTYTIDSFVKAVRALRFTFPHGNNTFYIRVVNMSLSWDKSAEDLFNALHPGPFGEKYRPAWNINQDVKNNDRLYVASAGNKGRNAPVYPAAYEPVLGVTGWQFNPNGTTPATRYLVQPASNYMYDDTYPVSGIFNIGLDDGQTAYNWGWTLVTPVDHPAYSYGTLAITPREFSGTSAAAPQVSALAYHLYSRKPYLYGPDRTSYGAITTYLSDPAQQIQGLGGITTRYKPPISFRRCIDNWGGL